MSQWGEYAYNDDDELLSLLPKGTPVITTPVAFPDDNASGWDTAVTTESGVRVREQPSLSGRVLMGLPKGTQLPANFDAKWLANDFRPVLFTQGRVHGYVHKDYLSRVEETPEFDTTDIRIKLNNALLALNELDVQVNGKITYLREQITRAVEGLD